MHTLEFAAASALRRRGGGRRVRARPGDFHAHRATVPQMGGATVTSELKLIK